LGLGIPAALLGAWAFAAFGAMASTIVVPLAFAAAYAWGWVMWRLIFRALYARKRALKR